MNKRPLSLTIIGWVFIVVGSTALVYHLLPGRVAEVQPGHQVELVWVCLVRAVAVLGGVFLLRGSAWARWLLALWMAYHVVLSGFHSVSEAVVHGLLFGVIGFFLFGRPASAYLRPRNAAPVDTTGAASGNT